VNGLQTRLKLIHTPFTAVITAITCKLESEPQKTDLTFYNLLRTQSGRRSPRGPVMSCFDMLINDVTVCVKKVNNGDLT